MSPLKVGVIGCGAIAQIMHIPYLDEYEQFELVALADVSRPVLDAVGDRYHIGQRFTDWRELLALPDIEAVVICHSGSHHATTLAALDAGKHVFVEKPLAWNLRETHEIAERVARSGQVLQVGYHKLYDPGFVYAKEQVEAMRDLGFVRITVLHPANELGFSPHRIRRGGGVIQEGHVEVGTWESQRDGQLAAFAKGELALLVDEALGSRKDDDRLRLGYGVLCSSIIHQIYTLFGFLGEPSGVVSTEIYREGLSIHSVIAYPNDVRVMLDWHFLSDLKDYHEEYAFYGNFDRVRFQLPSPYFRNFPSPVIIQGCEGELAWEKRVIVNYDEAFKRELLAFYDCVRKGEQPSLSSVEDAVRHANLIQQIIDAAR